MLLGKSKSESTETCVKSTNVLKPKNRDIRSSDGSAEESMDSVSIATHHDPFCEQNAPCHCEFVKNEDDENREADNTKVTEGEILNQDVVLVSKKFMCESADSPGRAASCQKSSCDDIPVMNAVSGVSKTEM